MFLRYRDALRLLAAIFCVVAIALAAVSHVRGLLVGRIGSTHSLFIRSEYGKLLLHVHVTDIGDPPRWLAATWPHAEAGLSPGIGGWWRRGGFGYAVGGTAGGNSVHQIAVPYWPLAVAGFAAWILARRTRRAVTPAGPPAASADPSPHTPRPPTR